MPRYFANENNLDAKSKIQDKTSHNKVHGTSKLKKDKKIKKSTKIAKQKNTKKIREKELKCFKKQKKCKILNSPVVASIAEKSVETANLLKSEEKESGIFDIGEVDPYHEDIVIPKEKIKKYQRGLAAGGKKRPIILRADEKYKESVRQAVRNELFLTEEAGFIEPEENEDTFDLTQTDIVAAVDIASAAKHFSLTLTDFGPYKINYSRDGRHLLLAGRRGHISTMDWVSKRLFCEVNVMESVHAISWLHLPTMFAAAQKEWVYFYDKSGTELHCVKKMSRVLQMEFLPYHFLLTTGNERGYLSWLDVSIGKMIKATSTSSGRLNVMTQNPYNAIIVTGHPNGVVKMWSPNVDKPLVSMLSHQHPVTSIAIDPKGLYMAVGTVDRKLKIFDVRTFECMQSYKLGSAAKLLNFSQRGLLSVAMGNIVEVYKNCCIETVKEPYLRHRLKATITDMQFCPYEDVLGLGHQEGFESILIPGAGEPNFDSYESNPYQTVSQRREMEVKALLEKIQPEMIDLDPRRLGVTNLPSYEDRMKMLKTHPYLKPPVFEPRYRGKGRSKSVNVFKRKMIVKDAHKRDYIKAAVEEAQEKGEEEEVKKMFLNTKKEHVLDRFKKKMK